MMRGLKNLLAFARGDAEKATVADLAPTLPVAEAEVQDAHAAAEAAEAAYRAALLTADDTKLQGLDTARREAAVRIDRAEAVFAALRERMDEAQAREAEAERTERYEIARRQADEARQVLKVSYPEIAADLVVILKVVAEAEIAVADANGDLPRGAEPLAGVEASVRDVPGIPRRLLSERTVDLWCRPGERMPGNLNQDVVTVRDGRGFMALPSGPVEHLVRRKFTERRFVEQVPGSPAYRLAVTLALPGLRAGDAPFYSPADPALNPSPAEVLRAIDRHAASQADGNVVPEPVERIELELVSEVDRERELRTPTSILDRLAS